MVTEITDNTINIGDTSIPLYKDSPEYLYTDKFNDSEIPEKPIDFLADIMDDQYFKIVTYWDKECKNFQGNHLRRSFGDLYALFKTYYPDITKKKLLSLFEDAGLHFYICGSINKVVFHRLYTTYYVNLENTIKLVDEQNFYYEDIELKGYTPKDLEKIYLEQ